MAFSSSGSKSDAERFLFQLTLSVKNKFEFEIESPNGLFKCQNSFLDLFYFLKFKIFKKSIFELWDYHADFSVRFS